MLLNAPDIKRGKAFGKDRGNECEEEGFCQLSRHGGYRCRT